MSLEDELKKWAASNAGKEKIRQAQNQAAKNGEAFGGKPGGGAPEEVDYYAKWAWQCLANAIDDASADAQSPYTFAEHLIVMPPYWDDKKEKWVVELRFEDTERDSLDPVHFPRNHADHIKDVVALLNHGYDADGIVAGYWSTADRRVRSLQSRNGLYFIQYGAKDFNDRFDGVAEMIWHPKYDGGSIDQTWEE